MRYEFIRQADHIGPVKIHDVCRCLELDSGSDMGNLAKDSAGTRRISREAIADIEQKMAIVLPVRNEDLKVFESVLSGIPHDCLIIVISNSSMDIFKNEKDIVSRFCNVTKRQAMVVHQKDPDLANAFSFSGYPDIIGDDGLISNGKSEGMIIGIILSRLMGKEYVGFIDTDNYIPGAVLEYVKHYATGFSIVNSPYSMVRILWRYKPKLIGELYFKKWGRVSEISNRFVNALLSTKGRFETEVIKTANAGEHAMSLELAMRLTYGSGYAVETQELISILENFSGILEATDDFVPEKGVEILQTESINPHLHAEKGDDHLLQEMLIPSLSVIYHSPLCEEQTRNAIKKQLLDMECLKEGEMVPDIHLLSPPQNINLPVFADNMESIMPRIIVPDNSIFRIAVARNKKTDANNKVVITDLDGTLLDSQNYSYSLALDAIRKLQGLGIPIVFCSSKTRFEQEVYREELGINTPFIVENGGAVYVPKDYFRLPFSYDKIISDYMVIEFGIAYQELRHRLSMALEAAYCQIEANASLGGILINSFGDMTIEEVAKETGLGLKMAALAKQREYSETITVKGNKKAVDVVFDEIKKAGLLCTFGGRFYEVTGGNDKGKAVKIILELYKMNYGNVMSFGIGNNINDLPLLSQVNYRMLVQGADKRWQKLNISGLCRVKGVGPEGWSKAIEMVVAQG
ncbi:MAG: bifunctional mannosyl-3-phosphoglycerate synthase/mannosyl-3 phosphoglycerate phosphatase [Dehalococcoidales bacterium]|nr:bifunctional mannosyl-3-phosphoglycerate synthase/mannosyl-3 phosphoglycerate phosphatase [Dehalococcoidales bacterium]